MKLSNVLILNLLFCFLGVSVKASPAFLTYQGRIIKTDGKPLEHSAVAFIFQITDPSGQCVVYQEQVNGINMVSSGGVFDVPIGGGTVKYPLTGSFTILDAFNNSSNFSCGDCVAGTCADGSQTYKAGDGDERLLKVQFYDGTGWKSITPPSVIRSVPFSAYSYSAQKLGNSTINEFLLKNGVPKCDGGKFLSWNGTQFGCDAVASGAGGTVTNVSSANSYLTVADGAAAPILTVKVGTVAGTVAAGDDNRIVNALQSGASAGGDLSGNYPNPMVTGFAGKSLTLASLTSGDFLKYDGAKWINKALTISDIANLSTQLSNKIDQSQMPTNCGANQTLTFFSPTGQWSCSDIAITGDAFGVQTAKTFLAAPSGADGKPVFRAISSADLPADAFDGIYFKNGGNSFNGAASLGTNDSNVLFLKTNNQNRLTLDATGNIGIGTNAPVAMFEVYKDYGNGMTTSTRLGGQGFNQISYWDTSASGEPRASLIRGRGTAASPALVQENDQLGNLDFRGYDSNSSSRVAASVRALVDGTPGLNDMPGRLEFQVTADGSNSPVTAMTIKNNGRVGIGTVLPEVSLDLGSKKDALRLPNGTTAEQPSSPANGMLRYNTTTNFAEVYQNGAWVSLSSGGGTSSVTTDASGAVTVAAGGSNQSVTLQASGTGVVTSSSVTTITNITDSTSSNNGALVVSGGVGVQGNVNAGGNIYSDGIIGAKTSLYAPIIYGGTGASETLTLVSTSDATKGNVLIAPSGGKVGVGTTTPTTKLDVSGAIRVGNETATCAASIAGALRFNSTTSLAEVCDGVNWNPLGSASAVPPASVILMKTCPADWTNNGTTATVGFGVAHCEGVNCLMCQSPATPSLIPANSILLMETCPANWTSLGTGFSSGIAGYDTVTFVSCKSPAADVALPINSRLIMSTCPASWNDLGVTGPASNQAGCGASTCRVCEVPGSPTPSHIYGASGGTNRDGQSLRFFAGAGGTTSGNGGTVVINGGTPTDGNGGAVSITAGMAASAGTARAGGNVNITAGSGAANGKGGDVVLGAGAGNGTGANGNILLNLYSTGFVGIGTNAPDAPLHVSTTAISGNIANFVSTGAGGAGCSIAWNGTSCSSDQRLKENIESTDNLAMLNDLLKVRPVHFTWKKDVHHQRQTGFIAQELEKIFPEFVTTDSQGYKQVNYAHFVSVLTAGMQKMFADVKEHDRQIASIQEKADKLEQENSKLKAENSEIKAWICSQDSKAPFCVK